MSNIKKTMITLLKSTFSTHGFLPSFLSSFPSLNSIHLITAPIKIPNFWKYFLFPCTPPVFLWADLWVEQRFDRNSQKVLPRQYSTRFLVVRITVAKTYYQLLHHIFCVKFIINSFLQQNIALLSQDITTDVCILVFYSPNKFQHKWKWGGGHEHSCPPPIFVPAYHWLIMSQ